MYGRRIYGLCISAQLLETMALRRETRLAAPGNPRFTDFSIEPRLASAAIGQSRGSSAGQLRGECGTSSALVRRKWVEPRLAALVGPVYIRDRSFKG